MLLLSSLQTTKRQAEANEARRQEEEEDEARRRRDQQRQAQQQQQQQFQRMIEEDEAAEAEERAAEEREVAKREVARLEKQRRERIEAAIYEKRVQDQQRVEAERRAAAAAAAKNALQHELAELEAQKAKLAADLIRMDIAATEKAAALQQKPPPTPTPTPQAQAQQSALMTATTEPSVEDDDAATGVSGTSGDETASTAAFAVTPKKRTKKPKGEAATRRSSRRAVTKQLLKSPAMGQDSLLDLDSLLDPDEPLAIGKYDGRQLTRRNLQSFAKDLAKMRGVKYSDVVQQIGIMKMTAQQFVDMYHQDFLSHMKSTSDDEFASADEGSSNGGDISNNVA